MSQMCFCTKSVTFVTFYSSREGSQLIQSSYSQKPYGARYRLGSITIGLTSTKTAPQGAIFVRDPRVSLLRADLRGNRKVFEVFSSLCIEYPNAAQNS